MLYLAAANPSKIAAGTLGAKNPAIRCYSGLLAVGLGSAACCFALNAGDRFREVYPKCTSGCFWR